MPTTPIKQSERSHARDSIPLMRLLLRGIWRPLAVIAIVGTMIVIVEPRRLVGELSELREWFESHGIEGLLVFLAVYVLAAVAIVPQAVLKVAAGGVYGSVLGVVVASLGSTLGATACFLIARSVARGSLMNYVRRTRQFRRLDLLTRRQGAMIVALSRLVPIVPGNLVNYAFGLTQVRLSVYVFWSWLGMLPGTVVLVVGTDAFVRGVHERRVPWAMLIVVLTALFVLAGTLVYVHRRFRRETIDDRDEADDAEYAVS